ncbi:MAG TPA: triose-phosphate isomerase [Aestuariivirga sp.]
MNPIRPLVAGNWKMNGLSVGLEQAKLLANDLAGSQHYKCDVMLCPPATLLAQAHWQLKGTKVALGGQDCHSTVSGAHTGDISADMLKDAGATAVIVGHSERRTNHKETDAQVSAKAAAAHNAGLVAIICIGETLDERKGGKTLGVLTEQIKGSVPAGSTAGNSVIAYEPIWAIGTGLTPTTAEVAEAHAHIRAELSKVMGSEGPATRILYGGSVKGSNAVELMGVANVNGALVGGASLKAEDFMGIIKAYA